MPKQATAKITVPGWYSLTPKSREKLLTTCIDACGRPRAGLSERCAECLADHKRRATAKRTAKWREKAGQR